MSEQDITREIIKALGRYPLHCHPMRRNSGSKSVKIRGNENGTPDIEVMCRAGRTCWLETKLPKTGPSHDQEIWHARARRLGHEVHVVRTVQEALDAVFGTAMESPR